MSRDITKTLPRALGTQSLSGTYRCTFENQVTECNLWVHEPLPELVKKISNLEVKEREPATFVVEVSSETAQVTWHKDGEPLDVGSDRFEFLSEGKERRIIIKNVSIHDEGEYTCSFGEQECTAEMVVIELSPALFSSICLVLYRFIGSYFHYLPLSPSQGN